MTLRHLLPRSSSGGLRLAYFNACLFHIARNGHYIVVAVH